MALYRDRAVVLRTYKLKESDRIVVFMTENHGKIRAVAKGVRKTGSRFGGRLQPMNHVDVLFSSGRDLDIVSQVDFVSTPFNNANSLDRVNRAMAMLEAVDQLGLERESNPHLYRMLVGGLETLERNESEIVLAAFFWKLLAAEGMRPELDSCVACGVEIADFRNQYVYFNVDDGGTRCHECKLGRRVSGDAIVLMRKILGGQLLDAISHEVSSATREVADLAALALEHHTERRLKTMGTSIR